MITVTDPEKKGNSLLSRPGLSLPDSNKSVFSPETTGKRLPVKQMVPLDNTLSEKEAATEKELRSSRTANLLELFDKSMSSFEKREINPTILGEVYKTHYGEAEYEKRLQRARDFNKRKKTGIDIDKIMRTPVFFDKHSASVPAEGFYTEGTVTLPNPRTLKEASTVFKGPIISLSRMFDTSPEIERENLAPIVIPHEGDHAQYVEAGFNWNNKIPRFMGKDLTPSGDRLTEVHAYGKNIVDILNRYRSKDQQIDSGGLSDPVKDMPKLADQTIAALKKELITATGDKKVVIENTINFVNWARKPFDAFAKKDISPSLRPLWQKSKDTLNTAFKGLVTIKDNRFVIERG
jgi:hypothetical protein